jgi:hypothetical protein
MVKAQIYQVPNSDPEGSEYNVERGITTNKNLP